MNRLKFPFELQAEGFIVGCAGNPPLEGYTYCLYVIKQGFNQFEWYRAEDNSSSHSRRGVLFFYIEIKRCDITPTSAACEAGKHPKRCGKDALRIVRGGLFYDYCNEPERHQTRN